jgi:hypothetical protein
MSAEQFAQMDSQSRRLVIEAFAARVELEHNSRPYCAPINQREFHVSFGRRYALITYHFRGEPRGSAWGFVDIDTGDLLKAASYKTPAKHARGHVLTAQFGREYGPYGPAYLR